MMSNEPAMPYKSANFVVHSATLFPFRVQPHTHRVTDATDHTTLVLASAGVGIKVRICIAQNRSLRCAGQDGKTS